MNIYSLQSLTTSGIQRLLNEVHGGIRELGVLIMYNEMYRHVEEMISE